MVAHTVAETRAFQRQAAQAGMTEAEIAELVSYLASNPAAGDEMAGTGGCRKLRVAGQGERANLSRKECNALSALTKSIVAEYRDRIVEARA